MDLYSIITTSLTIISSGGWFIYYNANKKKANGEAIQAEADGWAKQQDVYQQTIEDLKASCEFIQKDRNLLREENVKLRQENNDLRCKLNEMENKIMSLQREVSRLGRRIEAEKEKTKE